MKKRKYIIIILLLLSNNVFGELTQIQKKFTRKCDSINIETQKYLLETTSKEYVDKYGSLLNICNNIDNKNSKTSLKYLLNSKRLNANIEIYQRIEQEKKSLRKSLDESNYDQQIDVFVKYSFETLLLYRKDKETELKNLIWPIAGKSLTNEIASTTPPTTTTTPTTTPKPKPTPPTTTRGKLDVGFKEKFFILIFAIIIVVAIIYLLKRFCIISIKKLIFYKVYKRLFTLENSLLSEKMSLDEYKIICSRFLEYEDVKKIGEWIRKSKIKTVKSNGKTNIDAINGAIDTFMIDISNEIRKSYTENKPEELLSYDKVKNELDNIVDEALISDTPENIKDVISKFTENINNKIRELCKGVASKENLDIAKQKLKKHLQFLSSKLEEEERDKIYQEQFEEILQKKENELSEKYYLQYKQSFTQGEINDIIRIEIESNILPLEKPYIDKGQQEYVIKELENKIIRKIEATIKTQSTFYLTFPGPGFFIDSKKSGIFNDQSAYILKINPLDSNKGEFEFVEKKERRNNAVKNFKLLLQPVCEFLNPPSNAKDFILKDKGKVRKEGDKWIVDKKMEITFTY